MLLAVDSIHAIPRILLPWYVSSAWNVNVKWSERLSVFPAKGKNKKQKNRNKERQWDCLTNNCWCIFFFVFHIWDIKDSGSCSVRWREVSDVTPCCPDSWWGVQCGSEGVSSRQAPWSTEQTLLKITIRVFKGRHENIAKSMEHRCENVSCLSHGLSVMVWINTGY